MLKDRYVIERELGRGGIGIVYLARDTRLLSKPVVVKVLLDSWDQDSWLKQKFHQEIEALARIDHPSVVGVLDAGEMPDGKLYLVMQFVEGVTLRSVIASGTTALTRAAGIIRQIGHALSAAHDKGICHRDLKPENIMLQDLGDGEELVKLIDFGIAIVKDSQVAVTSTTSKLVVGTVAYMAPEQFEGKPGASSDVYALGVIAYEMLAGMRPFEADSAIQLYELQRGCSPVAPSRFRADLPPAADSLVLKALAWDPRDRFMRPRDFGDQIFRILGLPNVESDEHAGEPLSETTTGLPAHAARLKIALLYKRNAQPDGQVLKLLERKLSASGQWVFVDRHMAIGVEWAKEIERQIREADVVIPLLSAASVASEMLAHEIQLAHDSAHRNGTPRLLPVRVCYRDDLPETLAGILDPIQYAVWESASDDGRLADEILAAIARPSSAKPAGLPKTLEAIGGAVPLDSGFYITRSSDDAFRAAIARHDSIVLIKGARQMGKTSLLARGLQQARVSRSKVVLIDFQALNAAHLESIDTLLRTLAAIIAAELDLNVLPDEAWNPSLGASMNFGRYMKREVLAKISAPLVWGLDEVDRLFTRPYGSEFFGLLRSWHNARSLDPSGSWHQLTLAIAYATEAHLFITDLNQSPFNVGTRIALDDFSQAQVSELNTRYGSPLTGADEITRFFTLVGGHPYLVRRGLHEMATGRTGLSAFEAAADRDEGPFGDHLRRILVLLAQDPALCDVVRDILRGRSCPGSEPFYRLRSAGLISGESSHDVRPRCRLYETYLTRHLL